ncbi:hypothetical protein AO275_13100 [Pseudomonas viridiflava]|nr:hypothetical protein AO275_13100 [Pseudomonas viridiflava]
MTAKALAKGFQLLIRRRSLYMEWFTASKRAGPRPEGQVTCRLYLVSFGFASLVWALTLKYACVS